ncbi:MAG: patatin-like phospholipase family protein [Chitinophagaceae bacterium]
MKFLFLILFFIGFSLHSFSQSLPGRPKIGVTLSGGSSKGLAHIGILKAIDSAGLKIDFITGTSMGAVIGSLYSIGYSADSIEKIARAVDWDLLLSNQPGLRSLFMEEKSEYDKYDIELPLVNHKFKISTGFLEAQELWIRFSELYFPVYDTKDFSQFNIPFRAIATDVGNGEAVVLKEGEIISAVRSSMAIPSVFTAVEYDDKVLVDGGISRNFPVKDVKEMGADLVIGSTVATGLLPPDKVKNIIQLLLQIAFFREAEDAKQQVPLCDIYIPIDLDKYSMASFGNAGEIIKAGIDEGKKLYPRFKHLADSLNEIYGKQEIKARRLPDVKTVCITALDVTGLQNTTKAFFTNTINFHLNKNYNAVELADMVRQAFGTRYYSRIIYSLERQTDSSFKIVFNVKENPLTFLKAGIHYNRASGIGIIANITSRNFLLPNSRSMAAINIGESFRIRGEHLQYIGRLKNFGLTLKAQFDKFDVITYDKFKQNGLYNQNNLVLSQRIFHSPTRSFKFGLGHRFEWLHYKPRIASVFEFRGRNDFSTVSAFLKYNSLDRNTLPHKGIRIEAELGRVAKQHPKIEFLFNGNPPANPDSLKVDSKPYWQTWVYAEGWLPLSQKLTGFIQMQSGINFNYSRQLLNEFIVGGMSKLFRNQVTFAGLPEGSVYTPAMITAAGGLRTFLFTGAYLTGTTNMLFTNFISKSEFFQNKDFYTGYAITFTYNFALGPLDLSLMYSGQAKKLQSYINLGIPF